MNHDQLLTLLAIVDEGSFDAAAARLGITASAVSQRIKALEAAVGRVLVRRTTPSTATEVALPLVRMARQVALLRAQVRAELGLDEVGASRVEVAINADSFATWLRPLLGLAAAWPDVALRIHLEDQEYSADLLRRGDVVGAVTSTPVTVSGCRAELLGRMHYLPVATPSFVTRYSAAGVFDWDSAPTLQLNAKDDMQQQFLAPRRKTVAAPRVSQVPTSEAFVDAVAAGLGWALIPEMQCAGPLSSGELVSLSADVVEVELHWQVWRLESPAIERLTDAIHACAASSLH